MARPGARRRARARRSSSSSSGEAAAGAGGGGGGVGGGRGEGRERERTSGRQRRRVRGGARRCARRGAAGRARRGDARQAGGLRVRALPRSLAPSLARCGGGSRAGSALAPSVRASAAAAANNMFSVRIVTADYYMGSPLPGLDPCQSHFRQAPTRRVPVVRVFGATPAGKGPPSLPPPLLLPPPPPAAATRAGTAPLRRGSCRRRARRRFSSPPYRPPRRRQRRLLLFVAGSRPPPSLIPSLPPSPPAAAARLTCQRRLRGSALGPAGAAGRRRRWWWWSERRVPCPRVSPRGSPAAAAGGGVVSCPAGHPARPVGRRRGRAGPQVRARAEGPRPPGGFVRDAGCPERAAAAVQTLGAAASSAPPTLIKGKDNGVWARGGWRGEGGTAGGVFLRGE